MVIGTFADITVVFGGAICYALTVADRKSTRYLLQTPPAGLQQWAGRYISFSEIDSYLLGGKQRFHAISIINGDFEFDSL